MTVTVTGLSPLAESFKGEDLERILEEAQALIRGVLASKPGAS